MKEQIFFKSEIWVRHCDSLSPTLFNIYINDLASYFDNSCDPVYLNYYALNFLMYADDVVLLSTSKQGLQNCVNKLEKIYNRIRNDCQHKKDQSFSIQ